MSGIDFVVILIIVGLLLFWWDSLGAREAAKRAGKHVYEQQNVQFLDDTVSINRIRIRRNPAGQVRIFRLYRFEYSLHGDDRGVGEIECLGRFVKGVYLGMSEF